MPHGQESDLGSLVLGVAGDLGQGAGGGAEELAVDRTRVLRGEGRQFVGQREDDLEVRRFGQLRLPVLQPARPGQAVT